MIKKLKTNTKLKKKSNDEIKKKIKNSILNNEIKKNKLDHARWSKWPSVPMIKKKKKNQTCGLCV